MTCAGQLDAPLIRMRGPLSNSLSDHDSVYIDMKAFDTEHRRVRRNGDGSYKSIVALPDSVNVHSLVRN